jgi:hypothetical protein
MDESRVVKIDRQTQTGIEEGTKLCRQRYTLAGQTETDRGRRTHIRSEEMHEHTERHRQGQTDEDKDRKTQRETERITRQTHCHWLKENDK